MDIHRFEILYKTYQPGLVNFANFYLKNEQEAIDIVQELFMSIWENRENFPLTDNPKAYLMTSVKNRCYNKLSRNKFQPNLTETSPDVFISQDTIILNMEARETEKTIHQLIDRLPVKSKEIFILSRFEHFSYKEIAALLNISVKTVENQIGNAIKMIRKHLHTFILLTITFLQNIFTIS